MHFFRRQQHHQQTIRGASSTFFCTPTTIHKHYFFFLNAPFLHSSIEGLHPKITFTFYALLQNFYSIQWSCCVFCLFVNQIISFPTVAIIIFINNIRPSGKRTPLTLLTSRHKLLWAARLASRAHKGNTSCAPPPVKARGERERESKI